MKGTWWHVNGGDLFVVIDLKRIQCWGALRAETERRWVDNVKPKQGRIWSSSHYLSSLRRGSAIYYRWFLLCKLGLGVSQRVLFTLQTTTDYGRS